VDHFKTRQEIEWLKQDGDNFKLGQKFVRKLNGSSNLNVLFWDFTVYNSNKLWLNWDKNLIHAENLIQRVPHPALDLIATGPGLEIRTWITKEAV
jgi:hypothetical protein